jgi:hypothetical protein
MREGVFEGWGEGYTGVELVLDGQVVGEAVRGDRLPGAPVKVMRGGELLVARWKNGLYTAEGLKVRSMSMSWQMCKNEGV